MHLRNKLNREKDIKNIENKIELNESLIILIIIIHCRLQWIITIFNNAFIFYIISKIVLGSL